MNFFTNSLSNLSLTLLICFASIISCDTTPESGQKPPLVKRESPEAGRLKAIEIQKNSAAQVADGLKLSLWASDSLVPDPVAVSIDDYGRVYLTGTKRRKKSEIDIRGHRDWMIKSIALQSVEDRRLFLRENIASENSLNNEWLEDFNGDGVHDWNDLTVRKEEVWRLEDESGDGVADIATRLLSDFNEEITDVAGALLVRNEDVFVGVGPDMWRLKDTNGDGLLDQKKSISHGYGVHIGFGGHNMSGAVEGPDGKIYWGIGDIGANIITAEGVSHKYPNQGVIVRANPDGSNFEIFAAGFRNTHEFVFDKYGNIITSDNDGDHPGESERLMYVVDGLDAGWRINWQFGKYTDPKNNRYKVWMDEKLYLPKWEGQAAYIIPPIANYHNGPTGMAFNPGTALGKAWVDKFFLVEFVGDPSGSHIWSFSLKPNGASFELEAEQDILSGVLPTGIKFAPNGALYFADWINGWLTKDYGRVWKLDVADDKNDLKTEREETERLMTLAYVDQTLEKLTELLAYPDMRIRKKSQFELVKRGEEGYSVLKDVATENNNQLARIHAIWGLGQLAAKEKEKASPLVLLLKDNDPEIVAQSAKVLGDVNYEKAGKALTPLLSDSNPRVQFFAAQAMGRIKYVEGIQPLLDLIVRNNDEDVYVRHACVLALSRIGEIDPILALSKNKNRSLRIAAVLVLRRLQSPNVALFLQDEDEYIVTEAARAINDDWSIESALPSLSALLKENRFTSEPLLRRSINAALRVGGEKDLDDLIAFAKRTNISTELRSEALATIASWPSPSVLDRVDGRYRGEIKRDASVVKEKLSKHTSYFLNEKNDDVLVAISQALSALGVDTYNKKLVEILKNNQSSKVRAAMLTALANLNYEEMESIMTLGMKDKDQEVRTVALGLINKIEIQAEDLSDIVWIIFDVGTMREQQKMLSVLGEMPFEKSEPVLKLLINEALSNKIPNNIILDLIEAVEATKSESLISKLESLKSDDTSMESFNQTLYGGDVNKGRRFFNQNSTGQCVRCHSVGELGGSVGPALDNIGNVLTRKQILEALIEPSARLAPGFGTVSVSLKNGKSITGVLIEETEDQLILKTSEEDAMKISISEIDNRQNIPSGMPPMGTVVSKRDIRDVIEYMASLKQD